MIGYYYLLNWNFGILYGLSLGYYFRKWDLILRSLSFSCCILFAVLYFLPDFAIRTTENPSNPEIQKLTEKSENHAEVRKNKPITELLRSSYRQKLIMAILCSINFIASFLSTIYISSQTLKSQSIYQEKLLIFLSFLIGTPICYLYAKKLGVRKYFVFNFVIYLVNEIVFKYFLLQLTISTKLYATLHYCLGYMSIIWIWNSVYVYSGQVFSQTNVATATSIVDGFAQLGSIFAPILHEFLLVNGSARLVRACYYILPVILSVLCVILPETFGLAQNLHNMTEAENFYRAKLGWSK